MLSRLISEERPQSRLLTAGLLVVLAYLALAPFVTSSTKSLDVAAMICIYIVLVASFDLLIGYTGIVSFAHTMFFGIGAYGVAIAMTRFGATWIGLLAGIVGAFAVAAVLALVVGLFSLRVRTTYFSMITLAVALAFETVALQFSDWTGGSDGLSFSVPRELTPGFVLEGLGLRVGGRILTYYLIFTASVLAILLMLRWVSSPFGRVLQAIRENDFRAEALGYKAVHYRIVANVLAASMAALAGILLALWVRYTSAVTTLSLDIMLYVLLMVIIGGMGTLYGAVIGATLFVLAQSYLQDLVRVVGRVLHDIPAVSGLTDAFFAPERWLFWLGIGFVLCVCFFPAGVVGELRKRKL